MNCITINTDASFKNGVGAYAFYIVCDMFKIQKGGYFKKKANSSDDCELMCIGNALHTLLKTQEDFKCKMLVINTDSKHSINRLTHKKCRISLKIKIIEKKLIRKLRIKNIEYRHVKAHTGFKDARSLANEWCDQESKRWRIIREEQLGIRY